MAVAHQKIVNTPGASDVAHPKKIVNTPGASDVAHPTLLLTGAAQPGSSYICTSFSWLIVG